MSFVEQLLRPCIKTAKPYKASALENGELTRLDKNECPSGNYSRYPTRQPATLQKKLSNLYRISTDQLMITRGSDEAIDVIIRTFCEPNRDNIVQVTPTFEIYKVAANWQGIEVTDVPLNENFDLDVERTLEAVKENTKVVFLCSPNNPTGASLDRDKMIQLLNRLENRCLVVVDEAYIEFSQQATMSIELKRFPNLIVLRTLSKYWGGAGLRCGCALANRDIIENLMKVLAPFPLPGPIEEMALQCLEQNRKDPGSFQKVKREMGEKLQNYSFINKVWPTDANFFLVTCKDSPRLCSRLLEKNVVVRDRSDLWANSFRVSFGTEDERAKLFHALDLIEQEGGLND